MPNLTQRLTKSRAVGCQRPPVSTAKGTSDPTGICYGRVGGKDGKTLFVTATSGVYAIDIENTRAR
jgi:hypothetical protein